MRLFRQVRFLTVRAAGTDFAALILRMNQAKTNKIPAVVKNIDDLIVSEIPIAKIGSIIKDAISVPKFWDVNEEL